MDIFPDCCSAHSKCFPNFKATGWVELGGQVEGHLGERASMFGVSSWQGIHYIHSWTSWTCSCHIHRKQFPVPFFKDVGASKNIVFDWYLNSWWVSSEMHYLCCQGHIHCVAFPGDKPLSLDQKVQLSKATSSLKRWWWTWKLSLPPSSQPACISF